MKALFIAQAWEARGWIDTVHGSCEYVASIWRGPTVCFWAVYLIRSDLTVDSFPVNEAPTVVEAQMAAMKYLDSLTVVPV